MASQHGLAKGAAMTSKSRAKSQSDRAGISRRSLLTTAAALPLLALPQIRAGWAQGIDPLPSWNKGVAKETIIGFVQGAVDGSSRSFVPPEARIATFDQDGTLWVEHPMYTQVTYCLERVPAVVAQRPALRDVAPFNTVLSEDREAIAKLSLKELEEILFATLTGMTVEAFRADVEAWLRGARHPRWGRPYTELTYQPMQEVLSYLRANGFRTYIVTGGGQDFVRVYSQQVYGIPPEQVVGTAAGVTYGYGAEGRPVLT